MHWESYLRRRAPVAKHCIYAQREESWQANPAQAKCKERGGSHPQAPPVSSTTTHPSSTIPTDAHQFRHTALHEWVGWHRPAHRHFTTDPYIWGRQKPFAWDLSLIKALSSQAVGIWLTWAIQFSREGEEMVSILASFSCSVTRKMKIYPEGLSLVKVLWFQKLVSLWELPSFSYFYFLLLFYF